MAQCSPNRGHTLREKLLQALVSAIGLLLAIAADSHAANIRWTNAAPGDSFNTPGNWGGGVVPGVLDVAQFGISGGMFQSFYNVNFNNNVTNQALHVEDDLVTFNLSGRTYTLTAATGVVIGNQAGGFSGQLTVNGGTISSSTNIDVGAAANTTGTLIIGTNGLISGSPTLNIGKLGNGFLTVQSDGDISSTGSTTIGVGNGITGTATIIGNGTAGSATLFTGTLNVGSTGTGTVNVQLGGLVQNSGAAVVGAGSLFTGVGNGTVNVMNSNSVWNSLGLLKVGDGGTGKVNITLGGKVTGVDNVIGANVNGSGEVNVNGATSLWDSSGTVTIGGLGSGTLNITNQGVVENMAGFIGDSNLPTSTGTVAVNGAGSRWTNTSGLFVGNAGTGTLNITGGGTVQSNAAFVGNDSSGTGTVTVDGSDSLWDNSGFLNVGYAGEGTLSITGGGSVRSSAGFVGVQSGTTGNVTVNGIGSVWENTDDVFSGDVFVGRFGNGTLSITAGGKVDSVEGTIGLESGSTGHVTVDGIGSRWEYSGNRTIAEDPGTGLPPEDLTVGHLGDGTLEITNGGQVLGTSTLGTVFVSIGAEAGSTGLVRVVGPGSLLDAAPAAGAGGIMSVGDEGNGTLEITDGGTVRADIASIGPAPGGTGHVTVDGDGSLWDISESLLVGTSSGRGTLEITGGGVVQNAKGRIDGPADSPGAVIVNGVGVNGLGSQWHSSGDLEMGVFGAATLEITDGGIVTTDGDAYIGRFEDTTGAVTVAGAGSTWEIGGRLEIGYNSVIGNTGVGTLRIQPGGTVNVTEDTSVSLGDLLSLAGGTLSTTAINIVDGGSALTNFEWTSGTLHVGLFDGDLVNQAGVLAPGNSIGSTIIDGNYNQLADAKLQIEVGGIIDRDTVSAGGGNAFLGGDLELALVNGFVPNPADTIRILSAGFSIFNEFANVANGERLTTSDGLGSFVVNYGAGSAFTPNEIVLSAFQAVLIPGDYNQNGTVDAADYAVWRDNLGSSTALPNDDTAGVAADDYTRWKTNFGASLGSGAVADGSSAVPEPGSLALAIAGLVLTVRSNVRLRQTAGRQPTAH